MSGHPQPGADRGSTTGTATQSESPRSLSLQCRRSEPEQEEKLRCVSRMHCTAGPLAA
ncbi:hypothetical protein SAMN04489718_2368 [Actinopolyspora saharensis]|uniref:Uncharacterized protein n=1 Tax=Actinopolyspora saharensis TaxID=995062 RepID=A0A1H1E5Y2_9ACTN|nr:hypothetical protein SAMN04489718_2368 [Actinopolyspora saharensis]